MENIEKLTVLAKNGDVDAQFKLGKFYHEGKGIDCDYTISAKWFKMAADAGHAEAQMFLGWQYYTGFGVEHDFKKAFELYQQSALQGNACAQLYLGGCYGMGQGVELDYAKAVEWCEKAVANGLTQAQAVVNIYRQLLGANTTNSSENDKKFITITGCKNEKKANTTDTSVNDKKEKQKTTVHAPREYYIDLPYDDSEPITLKRLKKLPEIKCRKGLPCLYACVQNCVDYVLRGGKLGIKVGSAYDHDMFNEKYDFYLYDQYMATYYYYRYTDLTLKDVDSLYYYKDSKRIFVPIPENIKKLVHNHIHNNEGRFLIWNNTFLELIYANLFPEERCIFTWRDAIVRIGNHDLVYMEDNKTLFGHACELVNEGFKQNQPIYEREISSDETIESAYYINDIKVVYKGYTAYLRHFDEKNKKLILYFSSNDGKALGIEPYIDTFDKMLPYYEASVSIDEVSDIYECRKPYKNYPFHSPEIVYHKKNNIWQPYHKFGTPLEQNEWL